MVPRKITEMFLCRLESFLGYPEQRKNTAKLSMARRVIEYDCTRRAYVANMVCLQFNRINRSHGGGFSLMDIGNGTCDYTSLACSVLPVKGNR